MHLSKPKLTAQDKIFFAKHLAMFLKAGIPLDEALESLAGKERKSAAGRIVRNVKMKIENGQPLYAALADEPKSFDPLYVSMVKIGEVSATLEKSLEYIAQKLDREYALRKKVRSMFYYPATVIFAAVAVGIFVSFFVLPKLGDMFRSFDVQLPLATRILLFLAESMKKYGLALLFVFLGIIIVSHFLVSVWPACRELWHKIKLKLPITGKILASAALSSLFRNLGVMLQSGLALEYALQTEVDILENLVIKKSVLKLKNAVSEGRKMSEEMDRFDESIFPKLTVRMISVGEASGKLEESFIYLADYFEDETETRSKNAAAVLEPALLVFIALLVGFVAIAVILPMYSLTGSIHR